MPTLPSGRVIAINTIPLANLLESAEAPGNTTRVMALKNVGDLFPYVNVQVAGPLDADAEAAAVELAEGSESIPESHALVDAGYRLDTWRDHVKGWSAQDLWAMASFIRDRVEPYLRSHWGEIEKAQERLLRSDNPFVLLNAWLWHEGLHYQQDGYGDTAHE